MVPGHRPAVLQCGVLLVGWDGVVVRCWHVGQGVWCGRSVCGWLVCGWVWVWCVWVCGVGVCTVLRTNAIGGLASVGVCIDDWMPIVLTHHYHHGSMHHSNMPPDPKKTPAQKQGGYFLPQYRRLPARSWCGPKLVAFLAVPVLPHAVPIMPYTMAANTVPETAQHYGTFSMARVNTSIWSVQLPHCTTTFGSA